MNIFDAMKWISCDNKMPNGIEDEIHCLVTCQEWDIFNGKWGEREIRIMSYSNVIKQWNTKSDIRVLAWMNLPAPYDQ